MTNSVENSKPSKCSKWWLVSLVSPIVGLGVGWLFSLTVKPIESDMIGIRFMIPMGIGLPVGCLVCLIAGVISLVRRERLAGWVILPMIVSLIVLGLAGNAVLHVEQTFSYP